MPTPLWGERCLATASSMPISREAVGSRAFVLRPAHHHCRVHMGGIAACSCSCCCLRCGETGPSCCAPFCKLFGLHADLLVGTNLMSSSVISGLWSSLLNTGRRSPSCALTAIERGERRGGAQGAIRRRIGMFIKRMSTERGPVGLRAGLPHCSG